MGDARVYRYVRISFSRDVMRARAPQDVLYIYICAQKGCARGFYHGSFIALSSS